MPFVQIPWKLEQKGPSLQMTLKPETVTAPRVQLGVKTIKLERSSQKARTMFTPHSIIPQQFIKGTQIFDENSGGT